MSAVLVRGWSRLATILEMIKFEHTLFALPFALMSLLIAANGMPSLHVFGWALAAMVGARSAAMAFNRIADIAYDKLNPRTSGRALPAGLLTLGQVWAFTLVSVGVFVLAAGMLNRLALALSPVALLVIFGYSYTKRFTSLTHLVLGLALGIAPTGAWIAVRGRIDLAPLFLSCAVMLWTAGFDIIYALQDLEFDRKYGLFSLPKLLGASRSLLVSRLFHLGATVMFAAFGLMLHLGPLYFAGVAMAACLLAYEQSLVKPNDLTRVDIAFFNLNGFVSIGLFLFALADLFVRRGIL